MRFTQFARFFAMASMFVGALVLTGCASSQTKVDAFTANVKRAGVAYVQVNKKLSTDDWAIACDKRKGDAEILDLICPKLNELQLVQVGVAVIGTPWNRQEFISKSIEIQPGMIVKLDMTKPMLLHFVEVAATQETEACKWTGHYNNMLDRTALKDFRDSVAAFTVAAAVPVVGAAALMTSRNTTGGVECNGWSYKEAYKDFLASN